MERRVEYILKENEVTCIGDIRTVKRDLELMANKIVKEDETNAEYGAFMYNVAKRLGYALEKLEID